MNDKTIKKGKNEKEVIDREGIIKNIINIVNIVDDNDLECIYYIIINRLLGVESDFDKGYIFALLQNNKIN